MTFNQVFEKKWWVLISVGTGSFVTALGTSVVNTILPVIQQEFNADVPTIEWVITIYLLVISGLLLTFGRFGDMYGHKRIFLFGFATFVLSSLFCGFSHTPITLIISRGIQAIGGAMLAASSPAILTGNFPSAQRGKVLGLSGMMTYLGLTVGPSLGGWIAQETSWRYVFLMNIPVGILGIILSLAYIPSDHNFDRSQRFDLPGAFSFITGLVALLLGLNKGAEWGWDSLSIILLFAAATILLAAFLILEKVSKAPMLDLRLFKQPVFRAATGSAILNYICVYVILFLTPYFLIQGIGMDTAEAGLILTAQPVVMAIAAPLSGSLSDRIGSRLPAMAGMFFLAIGLFLMARLSFHSPNWLILTSLSICGLGTGIFISPNNSALMGSAPKDRQGIAAGTLASGRNVGMMLGIGLAGAILTSHMINDPVTGFLRGVQTGFYAAFIIAIIGIFLGATRDRMHS